MKSYCNEQGAVAALFNKMRKPVELLHGFLISGLFAAC